MLKTDLEELKREYPEGLEMQTSISATYNNSVGSGSEKADKVQSRVQVLDSILK